MLASPHSADATSIGKYQLIASLGHGGMADVFLAVAHGPVGFNKLQVIKRLRPNLAEEQEFLSMFLDEARLSARINHPNVVQTNEIGEHRGQYYIAMEYLDGQPLNRILVRGARGGTFTLPMALTVLADALAGLEFAHDLADYDGSPLGIVHRDASPHNIFVTYAGHTKMVDFGIAKAATRSADTRAGVLKGKIGYMSPEQARCEPVDRRADVFSIGVCLWEVIARMRMWKGLNDVEILERVMNGKIPTIESFIPDVPRELAAICARSLGNSPPDRYNTAAEFRADILAYLDRSSPRIAHEAIGAAVRELFADRRAEIKALLEEQLSSVKAGSNVSIIDLQLKTSSQALPRMPGAPGDTTPLDLVATGTPTGTLSSAVPAPPPFWKKPVPIILTIASTAAIVVGLLSFGKDGASGEPAAGAATAATSPPSNTAAATSTAAPQPTMIAVQIAAKPDNAVIFLDGAKVGQNPFSSKFAADGAGHRLRVEAEGHAPEDQILVFNKDVSVDVALKPAEKASADKPSVPTKAWNPPEPDPPSGKPGKPAKRKLDKDNPWE